MVDIQQYYKISVARLSEITDPRRFTILFSFDSLSMSALEFLQSILKIIALQPD